MPRFLSPAWFDELPPPPSPAGPPDLVIDQVVTGTPDGEVRYRVAVTGGAAHVYRPGHAPTGTANGAGPADLTITADWPTAGAIARGELSAQAALMAGRLRVRGNLARLSGRAAELAGLDPVPADVRRRTTY